MIKEITIVRNEKAAQQVAEKFEKITGWNASVVKNVDSRGVYYFIGFDNLCKHGWHGGCPQGCHESLRNYFEEV